ncbi:MAG: signal peptidase I [Roseburia sp.]
MDEKELEQEKTGVEENETSLMKEILGWIIPFVTALLIAIFIKDYLIINANVPSGSMENTIMTGDRLIGNRLAYLKNDPKRGDIIIFHYPDNEEEIYVKRVIGLPGETVEIRDGQIYIDGSDIPLDEPYLKEEWTVATGPYTFEIPEGCYLVMGDNRNDSWDARYWANKYVAEDKILGKAVFAYWPFSSFGKLE